MSTLTVSAAIMALKQDFMLLWGIDCWLIQTLLWWLTIDYRSTVLVSLTGKCPESYWNVLLLTIKYPGFLLHNKKRIYQVLRFRGLCCSGSQIRNWPFASQILNLTQSIDKKSENLQWEKCRFITDIEKNVFWHWTIF